MVFCVSYKPAVLRSPAFSMSPGLMVRAYMGDTNAAVNGQNHGEKGIQ
ncbi:hypothetical protein LG52_1610 [Geobacillus kaustophilus]|uniref:Uncharacterized protein n=1 Tax=Geobacillus kaustophilus TaxID=1462 RepID=A0A0D8BQX1_GEOKU|nr:hypothetical protein LG52_1610 [Geobacillus kaustophilus]